MIARVLSATFPRLTGVRMVTRVEIRVLVGPNAAEGTRSQQAIQECIEDFLALPMVL
jgi:hypothetical protein